MMAALVVASGTISPLLANVALQKLREGLQLESGFALGPCSTIKFANV
jgi:hypothetical protein